MTSAADDEIAAGFAEGTAQRLRAVPGHQDAEGPPTADAEGQDTGGSAQGDSASDGWVLDVERPTLDPDRAAVFGPWAALKARQAVAATRSGKRTEMSEWVITEWAELAPLWCRGRALGGIGYYPEAGLNVGDIAREMADAALDASAAGTGVRLPAGTTTAQAGAAVTAGWNDGLSEPMLPMAANDPRRPRRRTRGGARLRGVLPPAEEMVSRSANAGGGAVGEIVQFGREGWTFGNDNGALFALPKSGPRITVPLGAGQSFRRHLTRRLFDDTGRSFRAESYSVALDIFRATAEDAESTPTDLRVGPWRDRGVVLDLGRDDGQVVEVAPDGWRVVTAGEEHPVFRRPRRLQPLPIPLRGNGLAEFRSILALPDAQFRLVLPWLVTTLLHPGDDVPLLFWSGQAGAGKTTRAGIAVSVLDPRENGARRMRGRAGQLGRSTADILIAAADRYVVAVDNISTLSVRQSDVLCGIVTGATHDGRALYTDDESISIAVQRACSVTGKTVPMSAGSDLLDRMVEVAIRRMPAAERVPPATLWRRFHDAHAEILAAVLDVAVEVLAVREEVEAQTAELPRMATHGLVCASLDEVAARCGDPGGYLTAYLAAETATKSTRVKRHPMLGALASFLDEVDGETWTGPASELLLRIRPDGKQADGADWPGNGKALSEALADASHMLDAAGITFIRNPRTARGRTVTVTRHRVDDD